MTPADMSKALQAAVCVCVRERERERERDGGKTDELVVRAVMTPADMSKALQV